MAADARNKKKSETGGDQQTHVAFISTNFARAFASQFYEYDVSGYVPFLQEPESQSTGGGARARQPLVLKPSDARPMISIGWVNVATKECSLRTFVSVMAMHKRRHGEAHAALDQLAYEHFVGSARKFFEQRGLKIEVEDKRLDEPPRTTRHAPDTPGEMLRRYAPWLAIGALVLVAIVALALHALRR